MNCKTQCTRILTALMLLVMPAGAWNFFAYSTEKAPANAKLTHPEVPRMPAAELSQLLEKKADIVLVDTQSPDGYEMWHIPSAINIPYVSTEDLTNRQLMLMGLPMEKLIVIYCLCEEGDDSARMALELLQLGYGPENIKVLEGGLIQWDENGRPMIKQEMPN
ncbi:MAG: rhodanese-like domain-containing protein [Acidobacteria bacterium]|nr:rhodanese-like domain-containing protein [Acidobacteriota bacterium]